MGSLHNALCPCGFKTSVSIGGNMATFATESYFPFYCKRCGLVSANIQQKPIACPECNSQDIEQYGVEPISLPLPGHTAIQCFWYKANGDHHLCPKCKQHTLSFDSASVFFD